MLNVVYRCYAFPLCVILVAGAIGCANGLKKSIVATGKIIETSVKAAGNIGKTAGGVAIATAGELVSLAAKKGTVTLIDTSLDASRQVPWEKGITVYTARQNAKFGLARKTLEIVRNSERLKANAKTVLKPGDVVEIKTVAQP